jgi:hypothetical protein
MLNHPEARGARLRPYGDAMKKRDRNTVKKNEIKIRELPTGAMHEVKKLVDSASPAKLEAKELEHVER